MKSLITLMALFFAAPSFAMNYFLEPAANQTTTVDIDISAEVYPAYLQRVTITPNSSDKPTWGDVAHFYVVNSTGTVVIKDLGSVPVNPNADTILIPEDGSIGTYIDVSGGNKVRIEYINGALLTSPKVALNLNVLNQ